MEISDRPEHRRDLRDEIDFLPSSFDDLVELRRRLLDAGHRPQVVGSLLNWLMGKAQGDVDTTGSATRATYRRILRELPPAPTPPKGRGKSTEPERHRPLELVTSSFSPRAADNARSELPAVGSAVAA